MILGPYENVWFAQHRRKRCCVDMTAWAEGRFQTLSTRPITRSWEAQMALVDIPFDPNNFHNNPITNPYMPLAPGNTWVYQTIPTDPTEPTAIDTVTVTKQTKVIDGVKCVVVSDIAKIGNKAEEATKDYFAQDDAGNVWYFGEDTKVSQPGGVDRTGTW